MPDFDSIMRGMGRMKDNGYPIEWGPGAGLATTCSPISGPDEVPIEYTSDVLQIDGALCAARLGLLEVPRRAVGSLGHHQPRLARYYRVQRLFGFTEDGYRLER